MGEHRRASLHEDVVARIRGAFLGHIHILDAAVGGAQVVLEDREAFVGGVQTRDVRANVRAIDRELVDGRFDIGQRRGRV